MTIPIVPFTVNPGYNAGALSVGYGLEKQSNRTNPPITYWESISTTNTYPIHRAENLQRRQNYGWKSG
jgi:hypothetical protein